MKRKMQWIISNEYVGWSIKVFLQEEYLFSKRLLKKIKFDGGCIKVNNREVTVRYQLKKNDLLQITFPLEKQSGRLVPEEMKLSIVYEDEDILVINKHAGIAVSPSSVDEAGTISNGLVAYYRKKNISSTVHLVTRLDRNTSGLLLIAKHRYAHMRLAQLQNENKVKRYYYAIVEGHFKDKKGIIDAPIGRKDGSIIEHMVRKEGKRAVTRYQVMKETNHHTLLSVQLETGRTHQIRVHLSDLGHPLAGDDLYGSICSVINRQALHCTELSFPHLTKKATMRFKTTIPADMEKLLL